MLSKVEKTDPRVKRTRQLIFDAFMALFQEKSFQSITVHDITERAGINRATFYAHFLDKYELNETIIGDWFQKQLEPVIDHQAALSEANLKALIALVCEFMSNSKNACHPADEQYKPLLERQIQAQIYELILSWLGDRFKLEATAISWVIFGLGLRWSKGELAYTQDELTREAIHFIEKSLGQTV